MHVKRPGSNLNSTLNDESMREASLGAGGKDLIMLGPNQHQAPTKYILSQAAPPEYEEHRDESVIFEEEEPQPHVTNYQAPTRRLE